MSGPDPLAYVEDWHRRLSETGWWHSFELPDGTAIAGVNTLEAQRERIARFPIPENLAGKRVLDIGAWDGWFTFEMERRGADVVAIDRWDNPRFREMHAALGSRAEYRQMNVYDLDPAKIGRFDVVLFLGVFYHLKHPLLALERVCSVSRDLVAFESFALTDRFLPGMQVEQHPVLRFFERDDFGGQFDNWFAATPQCLLGMLRTAGFARAELLAVHDFGAAIACYRHWPEEASAALTRAPELIAARHAENFGINFRSADDDYVQCEVVDAEIWTLDNVHPEAGGFAAAPAAVVRTPEGRWRCNFKLPPGLEPGWHEVRLRRAGSEWSNSMRIAVDLAERADSLEITAACDAFDWTPGSFSLRHRFFSVWLRGLAENADRGNVKVTLDGVRASVDFVGPSGDDVDHSGLRQVNAIADARLTPGRCRVQAEFGGVRSAEFEVEATLP